MRWGLCLAMLLGSQALAEAGEVVVLDGGSALGLPLSARALGSGGAGAAVGWGDGLDTWTNPALVAVEHGVRWQWTSLDPTPGTDDGSRWSGSGFTAGAAGVGLQMARPRLEFGSSAPLPGGSERIEGWSAAASVAQLGDALHGRTAWRGGLSAWGDVAFGYSWRHLEEDIGGLPALTANVHDWGLYARVTPLDVRRARREGGGHRIDFAYAHAVQNDGAGALEGDRIEVVLPRVLRDGVSVHYAYRRAHGEGLAGSVAALFNAGLDPAFELGMAWDIEHGRGYETERYGLELGAARVLTLRAGFLDDPSSSRHGGTFGGGLAIPLGPVFLARWDVASEPVGNLNGGLERRTTHSVLVRLTPAVWWASRGRS